MSPKKTCNLFQPLPNGAFHTIQLAQNTEKAFYLFFLVKSPISHSHVFYFLFRNPKPFRLIHRYTALDGPIQTFLCNHTVKAP